MNSIESPKWLAEMIGQERVKESLSILIDAAKHRGEALDHLLFCGPQGLGKSTFAHIVANEMGVDIKVLAQSNVERISDLATLLTNLRAGDVLLVEQIERLRKPLIELLCTVMENFTMDIVIGKGISARSVRLKLPHFTVISTTSKLSQVNERLRKLMFEFVFTPYDIPEYGKFILLFARQQKIIIDEDAVSLLAKNSGDSLDEVQRLLMSVYKYSIARSNGILNKAVVEAGLTIMLNQREAPVATERQLIPDNVKIFVWQRDKGRCVICGSQENLEFDHIIPLSKGGSNTARNLQLLCEKHNRSKGANLV